MKEAFYHIDHRTVGRSTHRPGTASAHFRYITRLGSVWHTNTGQDCKTAARAIDQRERLMRANARVLDKLEFATPRGFTLKQCEDLALAFAKRVCEPGDGRCADWWLAVHLHDFDNNPHVHMCFCDRDRLTGAPVWKTYEKGSTERLRQAWEETLNEHLRLAGRTERAYRQSFKKRSIAKEPTVHEGPTLRAMALADKPLPPDNRMYRNLAIKAARVINTPVSGRTLARKAIRLVDKMLDIER